MWKDLKILLLGEPYVGKTSLILSLVSEEFAENVPCRAEEITIPADVTPEKVPTHIVDFSTSEQTNYQLYEELSRADVVCLVYDLSDLKTLEKLRDSWLPMIRQNSLRYMPVILVGNKSDLVVESHVEAILPIMNEYPEIETSIECSAKSLKNISEMFYFAQKAVLHPTGPLYSPETGNLKENCKKALTRIFSLCDLDKDGLLNDDELGNFQRICFNSPLAKQAREDVRSVIKKGCPGGVQNEMLTLNGFVYLHSFFIQRGRHETTWTVLRKFGYSEKLELTDSYLHPPMMEPSTDVISQLTSEAYKFLNVIFHTHDRDGDGFLSESELSKLFSVFPYNPWGPDVMASIETNSVGWLSMNGFFSQWTLTAFLDLPRTMEHFGYLGYSVLTGRQSQIEGIEYVHLHPEQGKNHFSHAMQRKIFSCKVVGPHGVGKTALLQGLLNRDPLSTDVVSVYSINTVRVSGQVKYLLLHEVNTSNLSEVTEGRLTFDVVCLLYDVSDPESLQQCISLYKTILPDLSAKCLVVATKTDQPAIRQHCVIQAKEFCRSEGLPLPLKFSALSKDKNSELYQSIALYAAHPNGSHLDNTWGAHTWLKICITCGILGICGYGLYKYSLLQKMYNPIANTTS